MKTLTKTAKLSVLLAVGAAALLLVRRRKRILTPEERTLEVVKKAHALGIPPSVALAVFDVEAGGKGFKDDRLIIRFEPHKFRKYSGHSISTKRAGQDAEYDNLARASAINRNAALMSISMGMSQVMGFNHRLVGYNTPEQMWKAFNESEHAHIDGFFDFVKHSSSLLRAAQTADFRTFAGRYNGKGGVGVYDPKMRARRKVWVARGYA